MYSVSQAYINKLKSLSAKRRRIRGTLDGVAFTENDIEAKSFSYAEIGVKSADIKLGGVFIGKLSFTFLQTFVARITRGTWRGKTLNVTVDLLTGYDNNNEPIWESVPLKPYVIDEANHSALGVDVVAYDYMSKFDATIQMNETAGNLYGMLTLACNTCGVTLGMTAEQVAALPNGDQTLALYPENDVETWRDLVSWCAVTAGGFATINRNGALEIRTWHTTPDLTIGVNDRFKGGTWSDFETNYTAVKVKYIESGEEGYYAIEQDTGLTLDLGANPLIQYGLSETKEAQARAILTAVQNLKYTPFKSQSLIDPALDLGDVIQYTDGIAAGALCCVMRIDFSFQKGATVQGYGKNPSLNGARNAQDKAIAQAASQNKAQGLTYYTYINSTAVSLTTTAQRLYRIAFATAEQTTVDLWHEVKWDITTDNGAPVVITYEYYLDGVKFDYEPVDTFLGDGVFTPPHPFYLVDVTGGEVHYWEVKAKLNSGAAVAAIGDIHAELRGQKLAAQVRFDGNIEVTDEVEPIIIDLSFAAITENAVINKPNKIAFTLSENVNTIVIPDMIAAMSDSGALTARTVRYNRVTEDGGRRLMEDGAGRITE